MPGSRSNKSAPTRFAVSWVRPVERKAQQDKQEKSKRSQDKPRCLLRSTRVNMGALLNSDEALLNSDETITSVATTSLVENIRSVQRRTRYLTPNLKLYTRI